MNKMCTSILDSIDLEQGKHKVAIMIGKFAPFTLGHLNIENNINLPLVICVTDSCKKGGEREFLSQSERIKLISKVSNAFIIPVKDANILTIIDSLRNIDMEPIELHIGSDRIKDYQSQLDKYKDKINSELKIVEIIRGNEDISATKVREALKNDDYKTYKQLMPHGLWVYFNHLKDKIGEIK